MCSTSAQCEIEPVTTHEHATHYAVENLLYSFLMQLFSIFSFLFPPALFPSNFPIVTMYSNFPPLMMCPKMWIAFLILQKITRGQQHGQSWGQKTSLDYCIQPQGRRLMISWLAGGCSGRWRRPLQLYRVDSMEGCQVRSIQRYF